MLKTLQPVTQSPLPLEDLLIGQLSESLRSSTQQTIAASPLEWATANATIVHPVRGRIAFKPYPYQAEFLNHFDDKRRIVLKARQIGFSQVFALEALYTAIHTADSTVLLVSRSQDLAVNLLRYCYQTFNNLRNAPNLVKANESEMGFENGSRIKSIPANRSTGRGFAANLVYLDEYAYAEYAEDIYQSVSPTTSQGGRLIVGSTPNGIGNVFHRLWAADDSFYHIKAPWYDCPAYYTEDDKAAGIPHEECEWFKVERPKYTERAWAAEFECDFAASGGQVFRNVRAVCVLETQDKPEQHAGHSVIIGADWGKTNDYTRLRAGCRNCQRCVDWDGFNKIDYHFQREKLKAMVDKWHADVLPERNSMGEVNIEELLRDGIPILRGPDGKAGWNMGATTKPMLIESLVLCIEQGSINLPKEDADELESYEIKVSVNGHPTYSAPEGMHDDRVIADALMWQGMVSAPASVETVETHEYTIGGVSPF